MREAVIVSGVRTAVGRAPRGRLRTVRPDDMAAVVIKAALERAKGLPAEDVDDVIIGCAFPEGEQGMNVGRLAVLRAGLPVCVPAMTVNRFCSSGLQTIALAAQQIMAGWGSAIIAGGAESMSMVPMTGYHIAPNPTMALEYPAAYIGMGMTAENVAREYGVSRQDQDAFSLRSHQKAIAAQDAGRFKDEIVPLEVSFNEPATEGRRRPPATPSTPTRDRGATRPWRRWQASGRPLPRAAPSPPATRRRPATARRRWWSWSAARPRRWD